MASAKDSFKWVGPQVECYNQGLSKSDCSYYISFSINKERFQIGDFALINKTESAKFNRIGRIACVYESHQTWHKDAKFRGIVRWYTWARDVSSQFNQMHIKFDEENEVIEDSRGVDVCISLEHIRKKCRVIFATENDPVYLIKKKRLNKNLFFSCRFKTECNELLPVLSGTETHTFTNSISVKDYVKLPSTVMHTPKRVSGENITTVLDSDQEFQETTPKKSPVKSDKPLCDTSITIISDSEDEKQTLVKPVDRIKEISRQEPQIKQNVRRNLNNSFNDSYLENAPVLNYSIVDDGSEPVKIKLRISKKQFVNMDAKVVIKQLSEELRSPTSPLKHLKCLNLKNNAEECKVNEAVVKQSTLTKRNRKDDSDSDSSLESVKIQKTPVKTNPKRTVTEIKKCLSSSKDSLFKSDDSLLELVKIQKKPVEQTAMQTSKDSSSETDDSSLEFVKIQKRPVRQTAKQASKDSSSKSDDSSLESVKIQKTPVKTNARQTTRKTKKYLSSSKDSSSESDGSSLESVKIQKAPVKTNVRQTTRKTKKYLSSSKDSSSESDGSSLESVKIQKTPVKTNVRQTTRKTKKYLSSSKDSSSESDGSSLESVKIQKTPVKTNARQTTRKTKKHLSSSEDSSPESDECIKQNNCDKITSSSRRSTRLPRNDCSDTPRPKRNVKKPLKYCDSDSSVSPIKKTKVLLRSKRNASVKYYDDSDLSSSPSKRRNVQRISKEVKSITPRTVRKIKGNEKSTPSSPPIKRIQKISKEIKCSTPKTTVQKSTPSHKVTPYSKLKQIKEGVITPSIQMRDRKLSGAGTPMEQARTQLHVSFVPNALPCREKEFADVLNFVQRKLLDGCGGCMYISGVPGTGKTATVTEVIRSLKNLSENDDVPTFDYVNINGMKLSEPRQSYVEILKQLCNKTVPWEQAQTMLETKFAKSKKKSTPVVLVVDELDILCTKRQDVVYNLLDWPTKANAQLIVITIANTMDLPERLLMGRVTSRLGLTRLSFQAYTHKQLQEIVMKRLTGTNVFNSDAVQLVARKVASVSGDARRALDICRRATEVAEAQGQETLVDMAHVNIALNSMITQPKVQAIKHCSRLQQLILQAVVAEVERTGVDETNFKNVYNMLGSVAAIDGFQIVSITLAFRAVFQLGACRLLLVDQKNNDMYQKIILNVSTDDVYYALKKN